MTAELLWYALYVVVGLPLVGFVALWLFLWMRARSKRLFPVPEPSTNSVIVITGCDSGIGYATTLELVEAGYHVVATTFTDDGPQRLEDACSPLPGAVSTLPVDITNPKSVLELAVYLEELVDLHPSKKVVGLVNNAGCSFSGPIEVQQMALFEKQLDVNLFGHIRVTQAVLPFVRADAREEGGRVVNLCSLAGYAAAPLMGAYAASKFAMEAVTDSLRREMHQFGVSVTAIEPGFIKTPLVRDIDYTDMFDSWKPLVRDLYRPMFDSVDRQSHKIYQNASDVSIVSNAIVHALTSPRPRTRYLLGNDAKAIVFLLRLLPDALFDELLFLVTSMR